MIQCSLCCNYFNKDQHLPRILVACGHTICDRCLRNILMNQNQFPCPECQTQTVVDQDEQLTPSQISQALSRFPVNLALLHMLEMQTQMESRIERGKVLSVVEGDEGPEKGEESEDEDSLNLNDKKKGQGALCLKHGKKIKAFCNIEKVLVCIDCILSDDHKNHEVIATKKAKAAEMEKMREQLTKAQELSTRLSNINVQLDSHTNDLQTKANECRQQISGIYGTMRKLMQEREMDLKTRISQKLEDEETKLRKYKKDTNIQLRQIGKFLQDIDQAKIKAEDEVEFLSKVKKRLERGEKALAAREEMEFEIPFRQFKYGMEAGKVCRQIQKQEGKGSDTLIINYSAKNRGKGNYLKYGKINLAQGTARNKSKEPVLNRKSEIQRFEVSPREMRVTDSISERKSIQNMPRDSLFMIERHISEGNKQSPPLTASQQMAPKQMVKKGGLENKLNNSGQKKMLTTNLKEIIESSKLNLERALSSSKDVFGSKFNGKGKQKKAAGYVSGSNNITNKLSIQQASEHFQKQLSKNPKSKKLESTLFGGSGSIHNQSLREGTISSYYAFKRKKKVEHHKTSKKKLHQSQSVQEEVQCEIVPDEDLDENKARHFHYGGLEYGTDSLDLRDGGIRKPLKDIQRMSPLVGCDMGKKIQTFHYQSEREDKHFGQGMLSDEELRMSENMDEHSEIITNSMIQNENLRKGFIDEQEKRKEKHKQLLKNLCKEIQNYIYVLSGFYDQPLNSIEQYDISRGIWKEITGSLTIPRTKFQAATVYTKDSQGEFNPTIYLLGGKKYDGHRTDKIEVFDPATGQTKLSKTILPKARSGFAALPAGKKIVVIGGNDGKVLNKVDVLDTESGGWEKMPRMLVKRDELAVTIGPDNRIYAVGGYGGPDNQCLNSAERFDPEKGQWEMIAPLNEHRRALAVVALPDGVYALGGYNGQDYLQTVEKYDLSKDRWEYVKSMNNSRCTFAAVVSSPDFQYIYVMGGFNGSPMDVVERYSVFQDCWEFITPMKNARFMHSCAFTAQQGVGQLLGKDTNQLFDDQRDLDDLSESENEVN